MDFPNPNPKAVAAKKFIQFYYPNVDKVEISYYTEDIPRVKVFFFQKDKNVRNESTVFREEIIKDLRYYLGVRAVNEFLFSFENYEDYKKNPEIVVKTASLDYEGF